jgi:hypothetical protein
MTTSINIYYQESPIKQVSTDEKNWIPISGYNNNNNPYFNLNENKDWCAVETSKSGEWLICFVKLQNAGEPLYFRGLERVNYFDTTIIFECYQVIKDNNTNKWIKKDMLQTINSIN